MKRRLLRGRKKEQGGLVGGPNTITSSEWGFELRWRGLKWPTIKSFRVEATLGEHFTYFTEISKS